jgi:hypothetical protein
MNHSGYIVLGMLAWATAGQAQAQQAAATWPEQGEFGPTADGLIYSAQTMGKLRHIVDSLNLKHKVCELRRVYRSQGQGQAHYVRLETPDFALVSQALAEGITPEAFKSRFPSAVLEKDLLVISQPEIRRVGYSAQKQAVMVYQSIPFHDKGEHELQLPSSDPVPAAGFFAAHPKRGIPRLMSKDFTSPRAYARRRCPLDMLRRCNMPTA